MTWDDRQGAKRKQSPEDTNNIEPYCHTFWILLVLVCCRQEAVCWLSVVGRISVDLCYKPQITLANYRHILLVAHAAS